MQVSVLSVLLILWKWEMVGPVRPQFVLFGSSIVEFSYSDQGWGAILANLYARKVLNSYVSCCCCSFHYGFLIFFVFRLINVVFFLFFFHCMHFDLHNLGLCGFKVIHSLSFLASVVNDDCKRVKVVGVLLWFRWRIVLFCLWTHVSYRDVGFCDLWMILIEICFCSILFVFLIFN